MLQKTAGNNFPKSFKYHHHMAQKSYTNSRESFKETFLFWEHDKVMQIQTMWTWWMFQHWYLFLARHCFTKSFVWEDTLLWCKIHYSS